MKQLIAKFLKKDRVIIHKTDPEEIRYAKHLLRQKNATNFKKKEEEQKKLLEARSADVKKLEHIYKLKNTNYDRNELLFYSDFLHDKRNYSKNWFYLMPDKQDGRDYHPSNWKRFKLFLTFFSAIGIGYFTGYILSESEDFREYVEEMVVEEQVYDYLIHHKKPVFLVQYLPGNYPSVEFMKHVGKASKIYGDKVKFFYVNLKNNIEYVRGRDLDKWLCDSELIFPYEEEEVEVELNVANAPFLQKMIKEKGLTEEELKGKMKKINSKERRFSTVSLGVKDRSIEGIEALFIEYDILKARQDPPNIIENYLKHSKLIEK